MRKTNRHLIQCSKTQYLIVKALSTLKPFMPGHNVLCCSQICVNLRKSAVKCLNALRIVNHDLFLGVLCISSFVVKQLVTTKSTKVTKFRTLVVPRTHGSQRLFCALCPSTSSGSRAQSRDASAVSARFLISVNRRLISLGAMLLTLCCPRLGVLCAFARVVLFAQHSVLTCTMRSALCYFPSVSG